MIDHILYLTHDKNKLWSLPACNWKELNLVCRPLCPCPSPKTKWIRGTELHQRRLFERRPTALLGAIHKWRQKRGGGRGLPKFWRSKGRLRDFSTIDWPKMLKRGGVKNPKNLADVISEWPLRGHVHKTSAKFSGFLTPPPPLHLHFMYCSSAKLANFFDNPLAPSLQTSYVHRL